MMDRLNFSCLLLACAAVTLAGCGDSAAPPTDTATADQTAAADGSTATDSTPAENVADRSWENSDPDKNSEPADKVEISLTMVDKTGYQAALDAQKGRVVLVDFWGTWCKPCRDGFPHTLEIAAKYGKEGLHVVAVAVEYDAELGMAGAKKFLKEVRATTTQNLIAGGDDIDKSFEDFGLTGEALPEYHIFDREGKRVKVFSADDNEDEKTKWTHEDVEAAVKEVLAQPKGEAPGGE